MLTTSPEGSRIGLYSLVRIGKLLAGMCRALLCTAAVYSMLWRYQGTHRSYIADVIKCMCSTCLSDGEDCIL